MNSTLRSLVFWMVMAVIAVLVWNFSTRFQTAAKAVNFTQFLTAVESGQIAQVTMTGNEITGVRKDDPRSDLYFSGCMLYHLLSGVPPLSETRDRAQRLNVSRFRSVKPLAELDESLPASVVQLTAKAMDLDPTRRFQSPTEMIGHIRSVQRKLQEGEVEQTVIGQTGATRVVRRVRELVLEGLA